ncbi:Jag N-terminal domain-containing protein [Trichloromonas sp.]|uniref:Jag N-terminal domain-containing protein n=1 Tax=Trichloromonas sp. TaxID=3069249 RepID=UPI003D81A598
MLKKIIETESFGPTVDDAVEKGLAVLGCTRADVALQIVQPGSPGLFGFWFKRPAVVLLVIEDRACIARRIVEELLRHLGIAGQVQVSPSRNRVELTILSEEASLVIGRHGQTLDALTTITTRLTDSISFPRSAILIDVNGYRARREQSQHPVAQRPADQVRRTGLLETSDSHSTCEQHNLTPTLRKAGGGVPRSAGRFDKQKRVVRADVKGAGDGN